MTNKLLLIGCGILKKEILFLVRKNDWPLETLFLDSSLHCDFGKLETCLRSALERHRERKIIVFYGSCHPLMDAFLSKDPLIRTPGQNCIEMLLGKKRFFEELEHGAYFLMEDWARRWPWIIRKSLGTDDINIVREIFKCDRKYLIGVRTPCSEDYTEEANAARALVDLPLLWMDASLDHLEMTLEQTIAQKMECIP